MKYNYKILIIDDNIIDQIVTKRLLKKKLNLTETYAVSSGKDGIVWLENFIKGAEDKLIILLDIKMPEMDGFAFLEEFEKLDKKNSSQIMIVMLSSTLDPNYKKRAKNNVYVKTLLNKPLPTEEFSSLLVE
jgi:CheY-like chemotaxis protein